MSGEEKKNFLLPKCSVGGVFRTFGFSSFVTCFKARETFLISVRLGSSEDISEDDNEESVGGDERCRQRLPPLPNLLRRLEVRLAMASSTASESESEKVRQLLGLSRRKELESFPLLVDVSGAIGGDSGEDLGEDFGVSVLSAEAGLGGGGAISFSSSLEDDRITTSGLL